MLAVALCLFVCLSLSKRLDGQSWLALAWGACCWLNSCLGVPCAARDGWLVADWPNCIMHHVASHRQQTTSDEKLFNKILTCPNHILRTLLPPPTTQNYSLRNRPHNRRLYSIYFCHCLFKCFSLIFLLSASFWWNKVIYIIDSYLTAFLE